VCIFHTQQQQRKQLTAYQVLVLFCRQDFGNSGQKVSATLEIISRKSFQDFGHGVQNIGKFWTKFEQLLPQTRFPVHNGSKEKLTMVQWIRNQAFKSVSYCKAEQHNFMEKLEKKMIFRKLCNNHHIVGSSSLYNWWAVVATLRDNSSARFKIATARSNRFEYLTLLRIFFVCLRSIIVKTMSVFK